MPNARLLEHNSKPDSYTGLEEDSSAAKWIDWKPTLNLMKLKFENHQTSLVILQAGFIAQKSPNFREGRSYLCHPVDKRFIARRFGPFVKSLASAPCLMFATFNSVDKTIQLKVLVDPITKRSFEEDITPVTCRDDTKHITRSSLAYLVAKVLTPIASNYLGSCRC